MGDGVFCAVILNAVKDPLNTDIIICHGDKENKETPLNKIINKNLWDKAFSQ